jgi:hypothetical protein
MAEIHLCDLLLLKVDRGAGCSVTSLALRQRAVLADLTRLLPRLAALQFGELDARVVPDDQGYRMRLLLKPRQRSLLLDPRNGKPTLEGEAAMLRDDIQKVGLRVLRAARDARSPGERKPAPERDLLHELLVRRARQDWRFDVEHQQIELPFPDCPRFVEDEAAHRVDGIVHAVTEHVIVVRGAEIWALDAQPRVAARMGRLCIEISAASPTKSMEPQLEARQCRHRWSQLVRLKRCALTSAIVGAIDLAAGAAGREAARTAPVARETT